MRKVVTLCMLIYFNVNCESEDKNNSQNSRDSTEQFDQELEDTSIPLNKAYWHLYKYADESLQGLCYFVPRPDNVAAAQSACQDSHNLYATFTKYDLCRDVVRPEIINQIPCETALEISTELHKNLLFTSEGPWIDTVDAVEGCNRPSCSEKTVLKSYCEYYSNRYQAMQAGDPLPAIARLDNPEEKEAIAACVNEVYGIPIP